MPFDIELWSQIGTALSLFFGSVPGNVPADSRSSVSQNQPFRPSKALGTADFSLPNYQLDYAV